MIVARARKPSRGLTVIAVLVCLMILTIVSGAVLKVGFARLELARAAEHRLQAAWLAESGAQRALARLSQDADFKGETWSIFASELGLSERPPSSDSPAGNPKAAAVVVITVERAPGEKERRRIRVQADFPLELTRRSRHTKEITIDLEPSKRGAVP